MRPASGAIAWKSPHASAGGRCVFIDRDGVLNQRVLDGFVLSWEEFVWRPDALRAVKTLADAHLPVVVVSNQSCVGRGLLKPEALVDIMHRMNDVLKAVGSPLAAWYCCPHAPDAGCDCRKPKPGMLRRCALEFGFDLSRSHMIGDTETDVAAGKAAGCMTYLIDPADDEAFVRVAESIAALSRQR